MKRRGNRIITLRLDRETSARLDQAAHDLVMSRSDVIRVAISQALDEMGIPVQNIGIDGQIDVDDVLDKR